jgi:hypothetical protein
MKTYVKTSITTEPRLVIRYDGDSDSPREWSNLGYFITQDRNYNSPDKNEELQAVIKAGGEEVGDNLEHVKYIKKNYKTEKILAIYSIVKYEHSGVSYSLGSKSGFDYSNNGFYVITDKTAEELGTPKKSFEKVIKQELEVYNQWCNGEVYGFTLYDEAGETLDSCWGFYDLESIRENLPEEWKSEDLEQYLVNN